MPLKELRQITIEGRWREVAQALALGQVSLPSSDDEFGTYWIEAGHRIREQVADDVALGKLLRQLLPPYAGGEVTLYRGENLQRWRQKLVGFCWTQELEVARMFGRGLNSAVSGGVLLRGVFSQASIISGPNAHSNYLQEAQFTIDPARAASLEVLEEYPPL